eukprot:GHVS01058920.1.p1 GENE.GHVS01058920.1~~GHVS01058920.1.p1  ORF type:complete len:225 (+),score=35.37 GHVS01058920.1:27-677(+)
MSDDSLKVSPTTSLGFDEAAAVLQLFSTERQWDQFHSPRNLCLALVGEVGELCELFGDKPDEVSTPPFLAHWSNTQKEMLEDELADCAAYLIRLSDRCEVNLGLALQKKIKKNQQKYPPEKSRGSSQKYKQPGTHAADSSSHDSLIATDNVRSCLLSAVRLVGRACESVQWETDYNNKFEQTTSEGVGNIIRGAQRYLDAAAQIFDKIDQTKTRKL